MITRAGGLSEISGKAFNHAFEGFYATSALLAEEQAKKESIAMVRTHACARAHTHTQH